jgi:hypothetical protein
MHTGTNAEGRMTIAGRRHRRGIRPSRRRWVPRAPGPAE